MKIKKEKNRFSRNERQSISGAPAAARSIGERISRDVTKPIYIFIDRHS